MRGCRCPECRELRTFARATFKRQSDRRHRDIELLTKLIKSPLAKPSQLAKPAKQAIARRKDLRAAK